MGGGLKKGVEFPVVFISKQFNKNIRPWRKTGLGLIGIYIDVKGIDVIEEIGIGSDFFSCHFVDYQIDNLFLYGVKLLLVPFPIKFFQRGGNDLLLIVGQLPEYGI